MDTVLYCLDPNTGKLKWRYYSGQRLGEKSAPVLTPDTVYIAVPNRGIVALDKAKGNEIREPKWTVRDAVQFLAQDEQYAYLLNREHQIIAVDRLNPANGEAPTRFTSNRKDFTVFATNTVDSTIYASTRRGEVYAIHAITKPGLTGELVFVETPVAPLASSR